MCKIRQLGVYKHVVHSLLVASTIPSSHPVMTMKACCFLLLADNDIQLSKCAQITTMCSIYYARVADKSFKLLVSKVEGIREQISYIALAQRA